MNEWISVNDEMPKEHSLVLVCNVNSKCYVISRVSHSGIFQNCFFNPTHWMPLPELPKDI